MLRCDVRHIIGISTLAIYDYRKIPGNTELIETSPLEENFPLRHPYVHAKRRQEDMIKDFATTHSWRYTILRPGLVYGPGRTWFHHLGMQLAPKQWLCLAANGLLPLTHVENCATAIVSCLEKEAANKEIINLIDDNIPNRKQYMQTLANLTSTDINIISIPWLPLNIASTICSWINEKLLLGKLPLPDILSAASLQSRCKPVLYSNKKAKSLLQWQPEIGYKDGLERCRECL